MGSYLRYRTLVLLLIAAALGTGCNILALPFFLLPGMDPKYDAPCKLASDDKDKEVNVVILASTELETRPEFLKVDRELSLLLCSQLEAGFKKNKEKVKLVKISKIEKYKDDHPNWHAMDAQEIGKYFRADYVINLEVNSLTLYEPGSVNTLFRGRADITIDVVDVHKPSEGPIYKDEYTVEYPKTKGPISADSSNVNQFRQLFLKRVAKELSWRFTSHLVEDDHACDD
ncbi:MAG TPA: hypothetical protein VK395_27230 [Gemmataceae bacterium]|nr:hypothetical protein [Gemmataceae bacterium]